MMALVQEVALSVVGQFNRDRYQSSLRAGRVWRAANPTF